MKKTSLFLFALAVGLTNCTEKAETTSKENTEKKMEENNIADNPLVKPSTLPYGAPDFTKIRNQHFEPAIMEGIRIKRERLKEIVESEEAPTFENTIIALEKSGHQLSKVTNVFSALTGAHTNDTLQDLNQRLAPQLSELNDEVYLN